MTQRANTVEGGTGNDTVQLTAGAGGNTGGASGDFFDAIVNGAALTFSTDQAHTGLRSVRNVPAGTITHFDWTTSIGTLSGTWYGRAYLFVNTGQVWTTAPTFVFTLSGATTAWTIATDATGHLTVSNDVTIWGTSSLICPTNAWLRLEWKIVQSATVGQVVLSIYTGANVDGSTATEVVDSGATRNTQVSTTEIRFGPTDAGTYFWDDIVAGSTTPVGPTVTAAAAAGIPLGAFQ